ncbi:argonaute/piwi family protein [Cellvibrio japonicus]|uniref:Piwi domain protein n=1 Tax=Cellvibrio japonicus (strain Ueda107) TaxID=498211 RepID=B3PJM7_CELJU|nr:nuclease PIN [Cellvibrio japonicus]ACE83104.1 Piwi domain protein [Cellvibrio japonicus Ueda107]
MNIYDTSKLPPFSLLDEPLLTFNPEDTSLDVNPLRGLDRYGGYSSAVFSTYTPELRIATIGPASGWEHLRGLVNILRTTHAPSDRKQYVPEFRGFEHTFGVPLVAAKTSDAHIRLPDDIESLEPEGPPSTRLLNALSTGMQHLSLIRDQFDVVLVHLPDAWQIGFRAFGFDAHDTLKAIGASHGIPTQVINDRVFKFPYKASLAWRLSIALYVKAGGIPWKLAPLKGVPDNTAYIGLAYALRGDPKTAHYVTCCSQVFDADGGGMQFVAFEARDPVKDVDEARRNPFLSRSDMRAVLARSLNLYQSRNGGLLPRRLVVHKTTSFKPEELEGALDALSAIQEVECVEVSSYAGWRGVWLQHSRNPTPQQKSEPDGHCCPIVLLIRRASFEARFFYDSAGPVSGCFLDSYAQTNLTELPS